MDLEENLFHLLNLKTYYAHLIMEIVAHRFAQTGILLHHTQEPNPLLLPLNLLSQITRSFSLMVRLFGNMMSHELVIAIVALLAGLLLPIPFLLLGVLIGIIQAFIFTVLAAVFIGAAVGSVEAA